MAKTSGLHFKVAELFANIIPPLGAISNSKQGLYDCVGTKNRQIRRFVFLVDYTGKISNLLEDLRKVEKFAQYIENQEIKIGGNVRLK
jgi:hypothetical protein